jgi:thiol-disulfide isomerase/thioredoxin
VIARGRGRRAGRALRVGLGILALTVFTAGAEPVSLGSVPGLKARDLGGAAFDLAETLAAGPTVITFWATWCKPCRRELPELQKLLEIYGERGLQVVAVNGDGPVDQAKIRPYVNALAFTFTVIPDPDGEIRRRFQVEVFPTTLLVDPGGRIVHRQVGYRRGDEAILAGHLETLLPGAPAPAAGEDSGR